MQTSFVQKPILGTNNSCVVPERQFCIVHRKLSPYKIGNSIILLRLRCASTHKIILFLRLKMCWFSGKYVLGWAGIHFMFTCACSSVVYSSQRGIYLCVYGVGEILARWVTRILSTFVMKTSRVYGVQNKVTLKFGGVAPCVTRLHE